MVQNVNPTFVKTPNWGAIQITTGTGSSVAVTIYTGGTNGSKVTSLMAVSLGTTNPFDVQWGVSSGGTLYIYGTASLSANAGSTDTLATLSLISNSNVPLPIDSDGNAFLFLPSNAYTLQAKMPATSSTWTTGVAVNIIAPVIGDF